MTIFNHLRTRPLKRWDTRASQHFLTAQPPLLFQEGNTLILFLIPYPPMPSYLFPFYFPVHLALIAARSTSWPRRYTLSIFLVFAMLSRGFALSTTKSALLPVATIPS